MTIRLFLFTVFLFAGHFSVQTSRLQGQEVSEEIRAAAIEKWEDDIVKLEQIVDPASQSGDAVLLIGSSTIRRWKSAAEDMVPYRVINRGYGGAKFSDVAIFADRLITQHQFTAMVVFVANDITGKPETDHTVEDVERWTRHIIDVAQKHQPDCDILLVEVTPTPKRWAAWVQQRELNAMLREVSLTTAGVYFVATAELILDRDGNPREDLFVDDQLHLNRQGYKLWSTMVLRRLNDVKHLREQDTVDAQTP